LLGASITEAACAAGVSRQTVSEWSNPHPPFQTELACRRARALRDVQQRLEEAALMAVEILAQIAADPVGPAGGRIEARAAILER
jgi:DNA-binding LacI/PurR family transcriptional regulator